MGAPLDMQLSRGRIDGYATEIVGAMRRHTGQRALYEAWSRSRGKPKRVGLLERLRPQLEKLRKHAAEKVASRAKTTSPTAEPPAPVTLKPPKSAKVTKPASAVEKPEPSRAVPTQPWLKTRALQVNAGRVEVSVPYQVAIAVGLGLILVILVAYRLGQMDQRSRVATNHPPIRSAPASTEAPPSEGGTPRDLGATGAGAAAVSGSGNLIVIARAQDKTSLEPVAEHFAEHGVQTGYISYERLREHYRERSWSLNGIPQGDGFLLTTMKTDYENPDRPGTDGYAARERIKDIGALYKGKPGAEIFGPNYFSDAYGLKVK